MNSFSRHIARRKRSRYLDDLDRRPAPGRMPSTPARSEVYMKHIRSYIKHYGLQNDPKHKKALDNHRRAIKHYDKYGPDSKEFKKLSRSAKEYSNSIK